MPIPAAYIMFASSAHQVLENGGEEEAEREFQLFMLRKSNNVRERHLYDWFIASAIEWGFCAVVDVKLQSSITGIIGTLILSEGR